MNQEYKTKNGAEFTILAVKDILKNPIYCMADQSAYRYFLNAGANLSGDEADYDGTHGISAYNKTDQMKLEDEDSTFFNPKFVKATEQKPIEEWIVSVGKHEGLIPSASWIDAQELIATIATRYNRPHRKTNALLSGLLYCPHCGKQLRVVPESNRWTNGKPRFKYVCPGFRKKECNFKALDGVLMDEFVVEAVASMCKQTTPYAQELFTANVQTLIQNSVEEQEVRSLENAIQRLKNDIASQVKNLREADAAIKRFVQDDIALLSSELEAKEDLLKKMSEKSSMSTKLSKDVLGVRSRLKSFSSYASQASPEVLVTLLQVLVERIYVVYENGIPRCHFYLKGCSEDEYSSFFGSADYIILDATSQFLLGGVCDSDRGRKRHPHLRRGAAAPCLCGTDGTAGLSGTHRAGENHARIRSALPLCAAHRRAHRFRAGHSAGQGASGLLLPLLPGTGSRKGAGKRGFLLHFHGGVPFSQ